MPMRSLRSAIRCGGIGAIIPTVPVGVGDGHVPITVGADIMAAGTVVGMVAAIGVVTGDITIIIPGIIRVGVAEVTTGAITVIPIVGLMETATGIHRVLPVVHIPQEMPPVVQVQAERALPVVPMLRLQAGL